MSQHLVGQKPAQDPRTGVAIPDFENFCCATTRVGCSPSLACAVPVHVDLHPDRPEARGIAMPPTFETIICRLPDDPTFEQIENAGGTVRTIYVSGEIPRVMPFEGGWTSEPHLMDERYAAVGVAGKGLVIFSKCSHAGIVNVVKDAVRKLVRPVYMVIGGLHLAGPELVPRIPHTVNFLANELRPAPAYVLPMHCSGFQSKIALERALGEGCVPAGVAIKLKFVGIERQMQDYSPLYLHRLIIGCFD